MHLGSQVARRHAFGHGDGTVERYRDRVRQPPGKPTAQRHEQRNQRDDEGLAAFCNAIDALAHRIDDFFLVLKEIQLTVHVGVGQRHEIGKQFGDLVRVAVFLRCGNLVAPRDISLARRDHLGQQILLFGRIDVGFDVLLDFVVALGGIFRVFGEEVCQRIVAALDDGKRAAQAGVGDAIPFLGQSFLGQRLLHHLPRLAGHFVEPDQADDGRSGSKKKDERKTQRKARAYAHVIDLHISPRPPDTGKHNYCVTIFLRENSQVNWFFAFQTLSTQKSHANAGAPCMKACTALTFGNYERLRGIW